MAHVWIIVTILFITGANGDTQHHRCHVCLSETASDVEIDRVFPGAKLESCTRSSEIMVCPDNYRGCLTQSKGDQVMRTCAQLAVDACRWANGVEYCYCMGELCNAPPPRSLPPSDDEDILDNLEGSGSHEPPATEESTTTTTAIPVVIQKELPASRGVTVNTSLTILTLSVLVLVWR
ncbi:uncharacterized protein LOC128993431 [Macrosteles quadrilineatus]|uniref:uncharacterized protein LOC128993431 n=1 Tax=Macrosteles quadrilineatus TaxID=74068 RepID=UPI0023E0CCD6|nr:uncharacterized protein LOC128993431 [Macrosteles quadrilineatus]